jgi:hypothetical protein
MLYVYAIQQRHASPDTYLPAFQAAIKCQGQITSIAIPGSLAQRYGVVLQELRLEVLRHNSHLLALTTEAERVDGGTMRDGNEALLGAYAGQNLLGLGPQSMQFAPTGEGIGDHLGLSGEEGLGFVEHSPGSSIVQMTGWGQFDSLVSLIRT